MVQLERYDAVREHDAVQVCGSVSDCGAVRDYGPVTAYVAVSGVRSQDVAIVDWTADVHEFYPIPQLKTAALEVSLCRVRPDSVCNRNIGADGDNVIIFKVLSSNRTSIEQSQTSSGKSLHRGSLTTARNCFTSTKQVETPTPNPPTPRRRSISRLATVVVYPSASICRGSRVCGIRCTQDLQD